MPLRSRQRLGKYRVERRIASGAFADVYKAYDTIEGVGVALKVPSAVTMDASTRDAFRREVRTIAKLDHPNVLPIKTAEEIQGHFVIVTPLGEESLDDRMQRRMARHVALDYAEQMLEALACAHRKKIAHLDVKPENMILFPDRRLRLADFGLARVVRRTLAASGSGTVGYVAPEQAMGRPSLRSDVFSAGLVLWRLMSKQLPEWPFEWPFVGYARVIREFGPELANVVRRACEVRVEKRYTNAAVMLAAFQRARQRAEL
ncbi:MAG: serine/threonine-protein kinase [Planctomycetota bacterium]